MNVLIVTAMYPPIRTGTSFYSRNLANALAARGHNVSVVTVRHPDATGEPGDEGVLRLRALRFPLRTYFNHFSLTSIFPENYARIVRIARGLSAASKARAGQGWNRLEIATGHDLMLDAPEEVARILMGAI